MNILKIREDLGKVHTCLQRRDLNRAVYLLCISLKEVGGQPAPTPIRGDFRAAITEICNDPLYKRLGARQVGYQQGKERELLVFFNRVYHQLIGKEELEDYETAMSRKLNLDRCINDGKAYLAQGKPSDADNSFAEAFKYYKNEFAAYGMMARAMMDAGQHVRAYGYIRKGLAERPNDAALLKMAEECARQR